MEVVKSIKEARAKGFSDEQILQEIKKQNPDKEKIFKEAEARGVSATDILEEVIKQNLSQPQELKAEPEIEPKPEPEPSPQPPKRDDLSEDLDRATPPSKEESIFSQEGEPELSDRFKEMKGHSGGEQPPAFSPNDYPDKPQKAPAKKGLNINPKIIGIAVAGLIFVIFILWLVFRDTETEPQDFASQAECEEAGFYWYDSACHGEPEPEPEPEPQDFISRAACVAQGFYWYSDACHGEPQPEPEELTTGAECERAGFYWYDGICHREPEPEPEPEAGDITGIHQCMQAGFYWYDGACHDIPESEFRETPFCTEEKHKGRHAEINRDIVYCDNSLRMWTPTLDLPTEEKEAAKYIWHAEKGVPDEETCIGEGEDYEACHACDTLSYAGHDNWKLPSCDIQASTGDCLLYDFATEVCNSWPCRPEWDDNANEGNYWSSQGIDIDSALVMNFNNGMVESMPKDNEYHIRCVRKKDEPEPEPDIEPGDITTQTECEESGIYWYDDACHGEAEPEPEPEPEPVIEGVPEDFAFERTLRTGSTGADVKYLQIVLNSDESTKVAEVGPGSSGEETEYFGPGTADAVIRFQEKYADELLEPDNLTEGTGVVGARTRAKLNEILN